MIPFSARTTMSENNNTNPADADASVQIEQVKLLYANLPVTQIVTLVVALTLLIVEWPMVDQVWASAWMSLVCLSALVRIVLSVRFSRRTLTLADVRRWRTYFLVTAAFSGIAWGSTAFLLYPTDSVIHQVFLIFVLVGMVAGGMTALTPVLPAFILFSLFSLLPLMARYFATGDFMHVAMGWAAAIYLVSLTLIGTRIHETISKSLYLRFENDQLIENLKQSNLILERRVKERTHALEEADLRKNEFIAMLAHELRNPLAPMSAAVSLFGQVTSPAMRNDAVAIMRRQLQQMSRLVDDLLDISRIQKGAISLIFDTVEVRRFLEASIETTRPQINASDQKITMVLPPDPVFVKGDEARLAQVISNILNNASKFAPHGGTIHIIAERKLDQVLIRVTDSGIGIPAHYLETIFDMFVQVDGSSERSKGGLGIGLALVKQIVTLHGGSVKAVSRGVGFGSEFIVMLPIAVASSGSLPFASRALPRRDPGKDRKILIVDDNVDAVQALAHVLRTKGHEVREAFDGQHALVIASEFKPEIVICDIAMPGMDGYEVAKRLRDMFPTGLTLIAVTGYGTEEDRARAKQAGFDAHFVKPANIEDLQVTIDRAKGGAQN